MAEPGQTIGPYLVERVLGRGGMGVVYAVRRAGHPAPLALKTLLASAPEKAKQRFQREVTLLRRVQHPNVLGLLDHGETPDGQVYLVTELVPGQDLRQLCDGAPLPPRTTLEVMRALADGVKALHAQGVVHRDLKPENVILRPDGTPVLLDFGIARADEVARLTKTGEALGTPAYMSPEQVDGQGVDERADVYGLAAILFYLLSGRAPFKGSTAFKLYKQVLLEDPEWPDPQVPPTPDVDTQATHWSMPGDAGLDPQVVRAGLCEVCRRGMAKEPDQRYPSVGAMQEALAGLARGEALKAAPRGRRGALLAVAALVLLGVGVAAGVLLRPSEDGEVVAETPAGAQLAEPTWDAPLIRELPTLGEGGARAAYRRAKPRSAGEQAALDRLQAALEGLEDWRKRDEAGLSAWAEDHGTLPAWTLGPLALLRGPGFTAYHHGAHRPPPERGRSLDEHVTDNAVQVVFCDDSGERYVTAGHRELKVWRWPAELERTVALPDDWVLTLCLAVQPRYERVILGGRLKVPKSNGSQKFKDLPGPAFYTLGEATVRVRRDLAQALEEDRIQVLGVRGDYLVVGTDEGVIMAYTSTNTVDLVGRTVIPGDVNVRGFAFLDADTPDAPLTQFYAVSGDDSDDTYGLYRYRIRGSSITVDDKLERPRQGGKVFHCLAALPSGQLYAGRAAEGDVARWGLGGRRQPLIDPRVGRAHRRSAVVLETASERGWLISASGWSEWAAKAADEVVRSGQLPSEPATLCVWDTTSDTLLGRYGGLHELDGFTSLAVTPDGKRLLAATSFGDVLGWELE